MKVTVDASVAVKWFVPEPHHKRARGLLGPRIERHAPDLLLAEACSAVWKKARRGEIEQAERFLDRILKLPGIIHLQRTQALLSEAMATALRIDHPVYDSLYVACASLTGSVLITADRRLARLVSDQVRQVPVITLQDRAQMAGVEAAAFRLVISRAKLEELVRACDRFAATDKSVADDLRPSPGERLRIVSAEISRLAMASPTYRGLEKMVERLGTEERVDLLVLGWTGYGHRMDRQRLFDLAVRHVNHPEVVRYIVGLGPYWRKGLKRWPM